MGDWSGWQYFDFSAGYASDEADTGGYLADIRGTSNEGVNFGNENASMIEGRRVIFVGNGTLDDEMGIPSWTNEAPWVNVTWEFEGTDFQPVEAGQLWGVYTREGNYALMEITQVPEAFGDTLEFSYIYPYQIITSVDDINNLFPVEYSLSQNYPNPFNPSTTIEFTLPKATQVKLTVYNVLGQQITVLVNGTLTQGSHHYTFDAQNLASGIYLYRIESKGFSQIRQMILLK